MDKPFSIDHVIKCGQHDNGADCRVFLLKFADYLSIGLAIDDAIPKNLGYFFFRLKLVMEFMPGSASL
ncbi:hypothetical protein C1H46_021536 [Malus baccata]|uniref:Ubiquitin-like protease family profile domain-containing protein n=1 Tax=Malus baccata TaxID=106549 RepID=A0A540M2E5_MALBA|nr:hypothetical protein C1H46_021536 [Malus baccata]